MIRIWPQSMLGQNLLLLLPLLVVSQLCTFVLWMIFVQGPRIDDAASLVSAQIIQADEMISILSPEDRSKGLIAMKGTRGVDLPLQEAPSQLPISYVKRRFLQRLLDKLPSGVQVRWQLQPSRRLWIHLRAADEYWVALPVAGAEDQANTLCILLLMLTLAAFPTLGAYLLHLRIERPLRRLALAAVEVERGNWPKAVPIYGPREMATVTEAFNQMSATLADSESARAEMLAGISHDIRTPLTKLRMVIAHPEAFDTPAASAERFVEAIDLIVGQFIDLARGSDETPIIGHINQVIEQLAFDYEGLGYSFELQLATLPPVLFRPVAIQRLLINLMQNAVLYGRTGLVVTSYTELAHIVVVIEDSGPGIAESELELMKQPFRRGNRNNDGGGTGLGLTIADRVAGQHGGSLTLGRSERGGLRATLRLPLVFFRSDTSAIA